MMVFGNVMTAAPGTMGITSTEDTIIIASHHFTKVRTIILIKTVLPLKGTLQEAVVQGRQRKAQVLGAAQKAMVDKSLPLEFYDNEREYVYELIC